jgi:hypothetical protein
MLTLISLGAGVQSTTLALMAAAGEIGPMPDGAVFADTRWEPHAVYDHLKKLIAVLPFPVHVVSAGNLREDQLAAVNTTGQRFAAVPWFIRSPTGKKGMGRRQCTKEYKLRPIQRKIVELVGGRPKSGTELWIGISLDEAIRRRESRVQYIKHRWPLLERGMTRQACVAWLQEHGWSAPKSACVGCPFHSDDMWRDLRDNSPIEWDDAVKVDQAIRNQPKFRGQQFMHAQRVPLDEVDLRTKDKRDQNDLFGNECEGMCGV